MSNSLFLGNTSVMPMISGELSCIKTFSSSRFDKVRQSAFVYKILKFLKVSNVCSLKDHSSACQCQIDRTGPLSYFNLLLLQLVLYCVVSPKSNPVNRLWCNLYFLLLVRTYEPRREKTGFLQLRKQRRRSASR